MFYNSGLTRLRERRLVSDMKCVATLSSIALSLTYGLLSRL